MSLAARLAALEPVGLEQVTATAALGTRRDRKYLVSARTVQQVLADLPETVRVQQIDGERQGRYASVYFDTPALHSYFQAAYGRRRRFKVRIRRYLDTADAFLEIKTRNGRGITVKERTAHPWTAVDELAIEGACFVAEALAAAGIDPTVAPMLEPVLRTDYHRATVYLPGDAARLTIDSGLTWRALGGGSTWRAGDDGSPWRPPVTSAVLPCADRAVGDGSSDRLLIVETKSPGRPSTADRLLWSAGVRPTRLSKYATGMAVLRRDLPANRWHRVLSRYPWRSRSEPTLTA